MRVRCLATRLEQRPGELGLVSKWIALGLAVQKDIASDGAWRQEERGSRKASANGRIRRRERFVAADRTVWYSTKVSVRFRSLFFSRYRGFRDPQSAELTRLNLVYGENNAGKSALVRIPALLSASRVPGRPGLDLGEPVRGAGFKEVKWRGPVPDDADPDLVLGVGLVHGGTWRWTLRWVDSTARSVIDSLELEFEDEKTTLDGRELAFDGLIPRPGSNPLVDRLRDELSTALDQVIWLEAKRVAPSREGAPRGASGGFSSTGEGADARVAADTKLRGSVSKWFTDHARCGVAVESLGSDRQRLVLQPEGAQFAVPFPDAGEGLQQAFAVVAALEQLRQSGGLLCVEEPESHLHPRLQQALAELLVDVLRAQPAASVLVETHSEVFLLAALKAAAGTLRQEVRLSWIETQKDGAASIADISLDAEGRPTTPLLEHAFATMGVMRRELIQARKSRQRGG